MRNTEFNINCAKIAANAVACLTELLHPTEGEIAKFPSIKPQTFGTPRVQENHSCLQDEQVNYFT